MSVDTTMPTTVVSAPATTSSTAKTTTGSTATTGIADNFQTFLTLLTTQLQNQNPLDPLDTNQFTQQLVQFAGVEQQLKSNDQLKSLIDHRKERTGNSGAGLCRQYGGRRRQHGAIRQGSATWNLKSDKARRRPSRSPTRTGRLPIAATTL